MSMEIRKNVNSTGISQPEAEHKSLLNNLNFNNEYIVT